MARIPSESIALSIWSPPYHVGKTYEDGQSFGEWKGMIESVIAHHTRVLEPGAFCVINIADILVFPDESMPRIQAETISKRRLEVTREQVLHVAAELGTMDRRTIATALGVSEQTVDRRLHGNNIRGGKYSVQTRIHLVGEMIQSSAISAGLYPYDRRIWVKDPAWANSRWHTSSFKAIDEFEYIFFLWKPGVTRVDRGRLTDREWTEWGSRAVWRFPSVRANDDHEAKFPLELPRRLIQLLTDPGGVVLDPFMGSGTTAVAAAQLGRTPIGIELSPEYAALAQRNLEHAYKIGTQGRFPI